MNFLNAKTVRLVKHFDGKLESTPVYTEHHLEQMITVDMGGIIPPNLIELVVHFDKTQKLPKRLSISVNQYTMKPYDIEIKLVKKNCSKPYYTAAMEELRTIVDLEPDTNKLIFSVRKDKKTRKYTQMRIGINHISF